MNGKPYSSPAPVRRVGEEVPWPHSKGNPRQEWWELPKAWTPWNWSEARDQFEAKRLTRSKI